MSLPKLPQGSECNYCGKPATGWDHVVPKAKGGSDDAPNLVPACRECNSVKAARPLPHQFRFRKMVPRNPELTHVQLTTGMRDKLTEQKRGNDTYDDVIRRALAALAAQESASVTAQS